MFDHYKLNLLIYPCKVESITLLQNEVKPSLYTLRYIYYACIIKSRSIIDDKRDKKKMKKECKILLFKADCPTVTVLIK